MIIDNDFRLDTVRWSYLHPDGRIVNWTDCRWKQPNPFLTFQELDGSIIHLPLLVGPAARGAK